MGRLIPVVATLLLTVPVTLAADRPAPLAATRPAAAPEANPVVVVELFTSEGCSSCPPADGLLSELAKPSAVPGVEVIPLAMHVDYWNRLGWADRFSSAKFSQRQEAYARHFKSDQVYTPQMIVDGNAQFVGSDRERAVAAIRAASVLPKHAVGVTARPHPTDPNKVTVVVTFDAQSTITPGDAAEVYVGLTEDGLASSVEAGENKGLHLRHDGVVRDWQLAGRFDATRPKPFDRTGELTVPQGSDRKRMHAVVLVQERDSRRVLAAGRVPITATPQAAETPVH